MNVATRRVAVGALTVLLLAACITSLKSATQPATAAPSGTGHTVVAIQGTRFLVNGELTSPGKPAEGLLLNTRMAQAIFDDENSDTVAEWAYPDARKWDPQRNTNEFVALLPSYAQHGIRLITVGLQGGCPSTNPPCPGGDHPWIVSAFNADGSLKSAWMDRLNQVITAADHNGIVVMVQFFYHGQNQRVLDQPAAVGNITDWLVTGGYTNVLVETANECDAGFSDYLDGGNCANEVNVIKQVQARSGGKLKVSVSWKGGEQPSDEVIAQEDIVLLHGNGINGTQLQALIASTKNSAAYKADPKPIVVNEDSTSTDNMNASVAAGVSWGYLDTGTNNYQDGFQRPPVNWTINTDAKKAFFDNALRLAGPARTKIAYSGPSGADFNDAATVGATLTDVWDNALPAMPLTFTLGSSVCAVRTNKSGQASCLLTPRGAAGSSSLSIAFEGAGIDALEQFAAASESVPFTVLKEQTTLTYEGDTTVINGSRANLSAALAEDGITPIAQRAIRLTLGSGNTAQSCQATSNAQGQAACSLIAAGQAVGSGTVSATFAGDAFYLAAESRSGVEVVTIHSGLSYTGPLSGDVDDAVTLTARLSSDSESAIPDATLTFTLGSLHCTAATDTTGAASCAITPNQAAGTYPLTAAFAGDARFGAATASATFAVTKEETKVTYTGATALRNGDSAQLAATLTADGVRPLSGRSLTLGIGSMSTTQTCTAITNQAGSAACSIVSVNQPVGAGVASATFGGDDRYGAASDQPATQVSAATASPVPSASPPRLALTGETRPVPPASVLKAGLLLLIAGLLLLVVPRRRRGEPPSIVWRNRE